MKPKFKKGDKVEFISSTSTNAYYFRNGLTNLEIRNHFIHKNLMWYDVWEDKNKSHTWKVRENELRLIGVVDNWKERLGR